MQGWFLPRPGVGDVMPQILAEFSLPAPISGTGWSGGCDTVGAELWHLSWSGTALSLPTAKCAPLAKITSDRFFFSPLLLIFLESICWRHESWPHWHFLAFGTMPVAWCEVEVSRVWGFLRKVLSYGCSLVSPSPWVCHLSGLAPGDTEAGGTSLGCAACMQEKPCW